MSSTAVTIVACLVLAWPAIALTRRRPEVAVTLLVAVVTFSAMLLALAYSWGVPAELVRGLIPVKDAFALLVLAVLLATAPRLPRWILACAAGLLAIVVVAAVLGVVRGLGAQDIAFGVRGLVVAPAALLIGLHLDPAQRRDVMRWGAVLVAVGAGLALIEYVLPWSFVTDVVGVGRYWAEVKGQPQFLVDIPGVGLMPGNATINPYVLGADRRLMGPFGDPLTAGVVLAVGLVWTLSVRRLLWRTAGLASVLTLALVLTLTRAGWILALAVVIPMVLAWQWRRSGPPPVARALRSVGAAAGVLLAVGVLLMVLPPARHYVVEVVTGSSSSTAGHFQALGELGDHGYSASGNGAGGGGAVVEAGTESSLATVALQLGLVLGTIYFGLTFALLWAARRRWDPLLSWLGICASLLLSWFVSEQWLTFNAGFPLALMAAMGGGLFPREVTSTQPETTDEMLDVQG